MRRTTTALVVAALPLTLAFAPTTTSEEASGSVTTTTTEPASAVLTPAPIDVTMYMHGDGEAALVDENAYAGDSSGVLSMDRTAPEGDYETKQLTNYAQGPNARCAGNGLLPVWVGYLGEGTVVGDATFTFTALGSVGGDVVVDVFTDVDGQACNEAYPEPVASTLATLPVGEGEVTVTLDLDGVAPTTFLMVQLRGADSAVGVDNPQPNPGAPIWPSTIAPTDPTSQGRVVYDGEDFQTSISFTCQPDDVPLEEGQTAEDALAGADCLPY